MYKYFFLLTLATLLFSCTPKTASGVRADAKLDELQRVMTGSFSSEQQSSLNESYYDIDLHMQPIWDGQGYYLYVEQAVAESPDEPYRQRVYKLERRGKRLISKVYELPEPDKYIGAYQDRSLFGGLNPDDLIEREGCAVILRPKPDGTYRGSTKKKTCQSSLRGAEYATSRVTLNGNFINSWDRGYDADGNQVWGATEGGYMFLKE